MSKLTVSATPIVLDVNAEKTETRLYFAYPGTYGGNQLVILATAGSTASFPNQPGNSEAKLSVVATVNLIFHGRPTGERGKFRARYKVAGSPGDNMDTYGHARITVGNSTVSSDPGKPSDAGYLSPQDCTFGETQTITVMLTANAFAARAQPGSDLSKSYAHAELSAIVGYDAARDRDDPSITYDWSPLGTILNVVAPEAEGLGSIFKVAG